MPDFSGVVEELTGAGYTDAEAIQATVVLSQIPQIDFMLKNPVTSEYMVKMLLQGFEPANDHQRVLVEGIALFSEGERQRYFLHTVEGMSMGNIAKQCGVSKASVQQSIERARKKLETLKAN